MTPECERLWLYSTDIERGVQALPLIVPQNFLLCEDRCYWLLTFCLLTVTKQAEESDVLCCHNIGKAAQCTYIPV
jgi:hypothetical protein